MRRIGWVWLCCCIFMETVGVSLFRMKREREGDVDMEKKLEEAMSSIRVLVEKKNKAVSSLFENIKSNRGTSSFAGNISSKLSSSNSPRNKAAPLNLNDVVTESATSITKRLKEKTHPKKPVSIAGRELTEKTPMFRNKSIAFVGGDLTPGVADRFIMIHTPKNKRELNKSQQNFSILNEKTIGKNIGETKKNFKISQRETLGDSRLISKRSTSTAGGDFKERRRSVNQMKVPQIIIEKKVH